MADDDEDDRLLAKDALTESRIRNRLECVENGVQLVDYLLGVGGYADR
jgi:two-component system response regulator